MPRRTATIDSLPEAFGMLKAMRANGPDRGIDCRHTARQAPAEIIRGRMAEDIDRWLDGPEGRGRGDRRNGTYRRRLLCGLGEIELEVPRTRRCCPTAVPGSYARRAREIDRVILDGNGDPVSGRKPVRCPYGWLAAGKIEKGGMTPELAPEDPNFGSHAISPFRGTGACEALWAGSGTTFKSPSVRLPVIRATSRRTSCPGRRRATAGFAPRRSNMPTLRLRPSQPDAGRPGHEPQTEEAP